jgi:hypothetical protein
MQMVYQRPLVNRTKKSLAAAQKQKHTTIEWEPKKYAIITMPRRYANLSHFSV